MAMSTSVTAPSLPFWLGPIGWVGKSVIGVLSYLGGVAALMISAAVSLITFPRDDDLPGFWTVLKEELWWLLLMGAPLVGLVHVAMGSFLSMQAYFGSTFLDGTGAVVGVGLLRNLATLMTGLTLSGLMACRLIPGRLGLGQGPAASAGPATDTRFPAVSNHPGATSDEPQQLPAPGRLAAPRMIATALASMLLALWGFAVGTVVGWQAAGSLLGLPSDMYFLMFYRMIWFRDVVGMIVKGLLFGLVPATICCFESLRAVRLSAGETSRRTASGDCSAPLDLAAPIVRAACLSMMSILLLNMTWFMLVYHAVPVYGPSLLQPPTP
jgi:phospholipid/cholesterol/gamma-HCH transport system permease protein